MLDNVIEDCRDEIFHTIEYRCVYDNKMLKKANNEEINVIVTRGYGSFKTEVYGTTEKIENAPKSESKFEVDELVKLAIKTDSNLSHKVIYYFLKITNTSNASRIF